jgi:hypothetical protein
MEAGGTSCSEERDTHKLPDEIETVRRKKGKYAIGENWEAAGGWTVRVEPKM